ncbi:hypothetical protein BH23ACT12_BH23ACT12_22160 [soil metagenome]
MTRSSRDLYSRVWGETAPEAPVAEAIEAIAPLLPSKNDVPTADPELMALLAAQHQIVEVLRRLEDKLENLEREVLVNNRTLAYIAGQLKFLRPGAPPKSG